MTLKIEIEGKMTRDNHFRALISVR